MVTSHGKILKEGRESCRGVDLSRYGNFSWQRRRGIYNLQPLGKCVGQCSGSGSLCLLLGDAIVHLGGCETLIQQEQQHLSPPVLSPTPGLGSPGVSPARLVRLAQP
eukprot:768802-Hanusia_phi.AAC.11